MSYGRCCVGEGALGFAVRSKGGDPVELFGEGGGGGVWTETGEGFLFDVCRTDCRHHGDPRQQKNKEQTLDGTWGWIVGGQDKVIPHKMWLMDLWYGVTV